MCLQSTRTQPGRQLHCDLRHRKGPFQGASSVVAETMRPIAANSPCSMHRASNASRLMEPAPLWKRPQQPPRSSPQSQRTKPTVVTVVIVIVIILVVLIITVIVAVVVVVVVVVVID